MRALVVAAVLVPLLAACGGHPKSQAELDAEDRAHFGADLYCSMSGAGPRYSDAYARCTAARYPQELSEERAKRGLDQ